jgi:hypothetical protein
MSLTGRFELRRTWTGKIVLQLEDEVRTHWPWSRTAAFHRRWRDAKVMDLSSPEMRPLIDLRRRGRILPGYDSLSEMPSSADGASPNGHANDGRVLSH